MKYADWHNNIMFLTLYPIGWNWEVRQELKILFARNCMKCGDLQGEIML